MSFWLSLIALYLPFQLALNPASGVDLASVRVLILGVFGLWLAQGLKNKKLAIGRNWTTACVAIFLFLNLLSIFWASNVDFSGRKLLFLFSVFPLYFVVSAFATDFPKIMRITKMLLWGGALVAVMGIGQFFGQFVWGLDRVYDFWAKTVIWPFLGKSFSTAVLQNPSWLVNVSGHTYLRATATFPDPHMFSFFLGMLIPLALSVYLVSRQKIYLLFLALMILADVLTFSRGGYLGLFAGIVMLIIFFWSKIGFKYKIAGAVVLGLLVLSLVIPSPISQRFSSSFNLKEGSNEGRLIIWGQALDVAREHPLLGVGIGNYPLSIKPTADYREPIYAHNTYLDIWTETGIFSLLAWVGMLASAFGGFLKRMPNNIFFMGGALSLVIFSVHSVVETGIYSPVVLTLLLIILGFSQISLGKNNENN